MEKIQKACRIDEEERVKEREAVLNQFYTENCDEDTRLTGRHGSIEFLTTTRVLEDYLPKGSRILEIGAGTGKYSLYYAGKGYDVTAVEYVEHNLDVLRSKITDGMRIKACQGDAVDLSGFGDAEYDVTLLFGPVYHLYEKEEQERAVREAVRVTKENGILAVAYLTSDSIMLDWVLRGHHLLDGYPNDFDRHFKMVNYPGGVFASFYIDEFLELMESFPLQMEKNIASDGMAHHFREEIDALSDEEFEVWLRYHLSTCERRELQGYSNHMLYIGRKV